MIERRTQVADSDIFDDNDDNDDDGAFTDVEPAADSIAAADTGDDDDPDPLADAADEGADADQEDLEAGSGPRKDADAKGKGHVTAGVQKRIDKATRQQRKAERERDDVIAEAAALRQQMSQMREQTGATVLGGMEREHETLVKDLARAKEDGDTEKEVDLTSKLTRSIFNIERIRSQLPPPRGQAQDGGQQAPRAQQQQREVQVHPKGFQWARERGFDKWSPQEQHLAAIVDGALMSDGFVPDDDEYYEELDKRLSGAMPHLYADDEGDPPAPRRKQAATPRVAAPSRGGGRPNQKVTVTSEDKANIRRFGLDPTDKAVVAEYAANKQARINEERRTKREGI